MNNSTLLSIIVPLYNEAGNIPELHKQITLQLKQLKKTYAHELIFIDDGSRDNSLDVAYAIAKKDPQVTILELVRNFGKEVAVTAGLNAAKGDAAIMIDADLQHPVEMIPKFLEKWEDGADVVVGVRIPTRGHTSILKRWASWTFYRIMRAISETDIVPNATDFRLIDRIVIDEFNRFTERKRLTRGLIDWLGFRHAYVPFKPGKRTHGDAAYSYKKLIGLAINSILSHSLVPLRVAGYLGMLIILTSGPLGAFILTEQYLLGDPLSMNFSGTSALASMILFLVGVILVCLGLIALYIANIYGEVVNRPLYIVRKKRRRKP